MTKRVKMKPEDRRMATEKWRKEFMKVYRFYLHKDLDKDVIDWLDQIDNKRQYFINLIKGDMNGHKKPTNEED